MNIKSILSFLVWGVVSHAYAGGNDNNYDVSLINATLLKDANAVKRYEYVRYEINNPGSAVYYYKKAVTILNEKGDRYAVWGEGYDKINSIRSVDAVLYDANGKKIKSLKNADIADVSGTSEGTLADDVRYKFHSFHYKVYPYTVEYEVEFKFHTLMFMPGWMPVEDNNYAVEKSIMEVIAPKDYTFRYKAFQYDKQPVITEGKEKTYHWEVNNIAGMPDEYASPEWQRITPTLVLGATNFEIDKYKGDMSNWNDFGKFIYSLKESRDLLPDEIKKEIHELTDGETDVKKKIEILYKYLQQNTRYISIQLGIGGWQPFDASYVSAKKYGDCKALTNFMYSLLKEAGIKSVYTLIKAGRNKKSLVQDFPSQQFNHVILSVPLAKDTVWLECTSNSLPAGYLSNFTADRYALMVTEEGGKLVRSPNYKLKDNVQSRHIKATLDESGKLMADVATDYKALQQDELFSYINAHTKKEQLDHLKETIDLPNYDITSFDYKSIPSRLPVLSETLKMVAENYAQVSGKRIFILPNIMNKTSLQLKDEERQYDIDLPYEFSDIDSVEITLPNGYITESLPQPATVNSKFGAYKIDYKVVGNKVTMVRSFDKKSGRFPKADYKELVKFYSEMYKADRAKVVLVKKEG